MEYNYYILFLAALIPLLVGSIWYNPKVFGDAWMHASWLTEEKLNGSNMPLIYFLCYVLSFFIAFFLPIAVIHQFSVEAFFTEAMTNPDQNIAAVATDKLQNFNEVFGGLYRTFKHGMLHGFMVAVLIVLPIIAVNALFERKSGRYILINWGFWAVCLMLMGGIICQWL